VRGKRQQYDIDTVDISDDDDVLDDAAIVRRAHQEDDDVLDDAAIVRRAHHGVIDDGAVTTQWSDEEIKVERMQQVSFQSLESCGGAGMLHALVRQTCH